MPAPFPFSRRRFVQAAAVFVAAPLIVPSRALGREGAVPAGARINLGFVGVGTQGRGHVNHFAGSKDVQIVAVCDVDESRRKHAQALVDKKYSEFERRDYRDDAPLDALTPGR